MKRLLIVVPHVLICAFIGWIPLWFYVKRLEGHSVGTQLLFFAFGVFFSGSIYAVLRRMIFRSARKQDWMYVAFVLILAIDDIFYVDPTVLQTFLCSVAGVVPTAFIVSLGNSLGNSLFKTEEATDVA